MLNESSFWDIMREGGLRDVYQKPVLTSSSVSSARAPEGALVRNRALLEDTSL